ncbi:hypothetical protein HJFPF1_09490 [Paramyrothecium foliicola]|nr:hypothetical protein HJFPF1_09490 [Paramyrothecium foliicola]
MAYDSMLYKPMHVPIVLLHYCSISALQQFTAVSQLILQTPTPSDSNLLSPTPTMKTTSVLTVAGLAAGAIAAETAPAAAAVQGVVKRVSTLVTVHAKLGRRDLEECESAASGLLGEIPGAMTATFPASALESLYAYASGRPDEEAILAGCGTVTASGALSSQYDEYTSAFANWFSTASKAFQNVYQACKDVSGEMDEAFDMLSVCPSYVAAITGDAASSTGSTPATTDATTSAEETTSADEASTTEVTSTPADEASTTEGTTTEETSPAEETTTSTEDPTPTGGSSRQSAAAFAAVGMAVLAAL